MDQLDLYLGPTILPYGRLWPSGDDDDDNDDGDGDDDRYGLSSTCYIKGDQVGWRGGQAVGGGYFDVVVTLMMMRTIQMT